MDESTIDVRALAKAHGLSDEELARAEGALGRALSVPEVGVLSAMWSEHCAYKSSRVHLARLHTTGAQVVQGPGENAGIIDLGEGWVAAFKMESHNHPSFIEPYQGAATGVGGILRDVFTMGARPIALLNSLRFGAIDHARTAHLFHGVVAGIAGYGNCVGVPNVGGEVYFDDCYNGNILVNVFALGVARHDAIFRGVATGVGNPIFYVGASTGRDGIHGATMASAQFDEGSASRRPTVQIGDPFRERLLIEACLELMRTGAIIGIQDMGAAGLTSSAVEMAERGHNGVRLDVDLVPAREPGMSAYEFLLSESQERMLMVLERGREAEVAQVFERWELAYAQIGEVIEGDRFEVYQGGAKVVDLPVALLTSDAPRYDRPQQRPAYLDALRAARPAREVGCRTALMRLLGSPNICSRRAIFSQYDHQVGLGTVVGPGQGDAAVLRVPGTDRALAIAVDCNSRFVYLEPFEGARLAVAECARNLVCVGAWPRATTNCLNFGDPTHPEVMWQLSRAIDGLADACRALDVPVVSGNVSLYNASHGQDIYPTPTVALVGVFPDGIDAASGTLRGTVGMGFTRPGARVFLLGKTDSGDLGGSAFLHQLHDQLGDRPPHLDMAREIAVQRATREAIAAGLVLSAHDCSEGGLGVALAECCLAAAEPLGMTLHVSAPRRPDLWLFSESPSRVIVSVMPEQVTQLEAIAARHGAPCVPLGSVTQSPELSWPQVMSASLDAMRQVYEGGLRGL